MTIFYEDLISNPKDIIAKMFDILKISPDHVEKALQALEKDSQNNLLAPRGKPKKELSDKDWEDFDRVLEQLMPRKMSYKMTIDEFKTMFSE